MLKMDLNDVRFDALFADAVIYAKSAVVKAVQIEAEALQANVYQDKDVRRDEETGKYVVDTYVTDVVNGVFKVRLEDTRPVVPGEWIVTNPKAWAQERENNYAVPDETFRKKYERIGETDQYRAKGMARIIQNDTGEEVTIEAPWGGEQSGSADCYFCAPYDRTNPKDLAKGDRYLISANDFAKTYAPADEVLGQDWR